MLKFQQSSVKAKRDDLIGRKIRFPLEEGAGLFGDTSRKQSWWEDDQDYWVRTLSHAQQLHIFDRQKMGED